MDTTFLMQNLWLIGILLMWDIASKAVAMWKAARNNELGWYIVLLLFNSLGILPILYIYFIDRQRKAS